MSAGKLINTISVQRLNAGAVNAFGTVAATWDQVALLRAELVELKGEAALEARGADDQLMTIFKVRNRVACTTADRVLFRAKAYRILGLVEVGRRQWLELHCESFTEGAA